MGLASPIRILFNLGRVGSMAVDVITKFNFQTFLSSSDVYKAGIRNRGKALVSIEEFTPVDSDQLEVTLAVTRRLNQEDKEFVLVFRQPNEVYNIPVEIKSREEERVYILEKKGQVVYIEDRRDYERVEIGKKVEYYPAQRNRNVNHLYTGVIKDISASGAQLVTTRELNTSNPIVLDTTFLELSLDELVGKVVWKEEMKSRKYANGIQFKFSEPEERTALIDYLYQDEKEDDEAEE